MRVLILLTCFIVGTGADAATRTNITSNAAGARAAGSAAGTTAAYNYNYMYPYMNNQMRTALNPGVNPSQAGNPISVITHTEQLPSGRRVVPRGGTTSASTARSATGAAPQMAARSATTGMSATAARSATNASARRVVSRSATATNSTNRATQNTRTNTIAATPVTTTTTTVTTARCLADYTQCMNDYCARENTAYNRCYCSSRLAQIDSEYQPAIDKLIKQILTIKSDNRWSDAEMSAYWMDTIGKYSGTNSWENLDTALDINWADMESRVRGQRAFNTGHEYCIGYLKNCAYAASNLRDAYRSDIARDCDTYEQSLMRLKNAAESIIGTYSE